ncbi:hypothetical protein [Commensalibacter oyaizuii]|uniref:Uncharacterized protein n=1 Tax=Commensalibacter oyaizuii TaxID=3043873 RepID=A0ABT6Q3M4_9PROT|nr:hypothetical protein [Commensalibacter sp. TBRC 16381]MDI2091615.1 hypothetical protein [Commensalibacter sp. TBRC 16381]
MSKKLSSKKKISNDDATRFAHLLKSRAEDSDQDDIDAEEDEENSAEEDQEAEDPEDQNGRAKGKKAKAKKAKRAKAEEEEEPEAEEEDDPDAEDEGDDETDAEDEEDDTTAQARARERGRCAAIFGCKAAANNLALAAELAFGTNIPRSQAIRLLNAGGIAKPASSNKPSRTALYNQRMMQERRSLSVGAPRPSQPCNQNKAAASSILKAGMVTGAVKKDIKL